MTIEEQDEIVLKYSGLMGHPIVGIVTGPDGNSLRAMEANEPDEVLMHVKDKTLRVYERDGEGKPYRLVLARTEDGLTVVFPPVPDKFMPAYAEGILAVLDALGFDWDDEETSPPDDAGESTITLHGVRSEAGIGG